MAAAETRFRVMASEAHVVVVDGPDQAVGTARRALIELEQAWSRFLPHSDISRLNNWPNTPVVVNEATVTLIETMVQAWELTEGLYNPSILPALLEAGYRFSVDDVELCTQLPPSADTKPGDLTQIALSRKDRTVTLPEGMALDPGGIGKGLAADLVVAELLAQGAAGALVCIGGDLAAAGTPPSHAGWPIAIEDPTDPATHIVEVVIGGGGVATSSTLSRRWLQEKTERHHVINPITGTVARTDLTAVTIFAPAGWLAEAHATAALLGGAQRFTWYAQRFDIQGVAITHDGHLIETPALGVVRRMAVPA